MKKLFVVSLMLFALMLVYSSAVAESELSAVSKGVKIGVGFGKWTGSDAKLDDGFGNIIDPTYRSGLTFGAFITIPVNTSVSIQPELLYVVKGTKYEEGGESATFKIDYIEIPVLIKYSFSTSGNIKPNIFFGPALNIKASSKLKVEFLGESAEVDLENIKGTELSFQFGGGFDFVTDSKTFIIDFRYDLGLSKIPGTEEGFVSADAAGLEDGLDLKNSAFSVMFGIVF